MPFIDILDDNRKKTGWFHINLGPKGNREATYCPWCAREGLRQLTSALCDAKVARGTCDAPMCEYHSTKGGKNVDYCPKHKHCVTPSLFEGQPT